LFKREITKYYDWVLFKKIKKDINDIKKEMKEIRICFDNNFEELKSLIKGKREMETEDINKTQFLNLKRERSAP
jgi:hypothetical protein